MGRIRHLTDARIAQILDIINNTPYIEGPLKSGKLSRVEKLRKLGYEVRKVTLRPVSCPVGKLHEYKKEARFQIGSKTGYYAWCVILAPLPYDKIREINLKTFHGYPHI
jgi:hypothetical protein